MFGKKITVSWESVGKIALALLGLVPAIVLLINFLNSRSPQITVKNELAFPVRIYSNEEYQGIVPGDSKRTFRFYSERIFPIQISWQGVAQEDQNGGTVGENVTGTIELVDNHQTVNVTYTSGKIDYFMPILTNKTDMTCRVFVNKGLPSEKYGGLLLPQAKRVNIGYYKWLVNSNVTLDCNDGLHWWGDKNGKKGPALEVEGPNGQTNLTLNP
ncbi:MAG: hypothetical protein H6634_05335 [Anaerolineales bacterium]|nr:hypothetical protein [Anaerolineales bacterium]